MIKIKLTMSQSLIRLVFLTISMVFTISLFGQRAAKFKFNIVDGDSILYEDVFLKELKDSSIFIGTSIREVDDRIQVEEPFTELEVTSLHTLIFERRNKPRVVAGGIAGMLCGIVIAAAIQEPEPEPSGLELDIGPDPKILVGAVGFVGGALIGLIANSPRTFKINGSQRSYNSLKPFLEKYVYEG